MKHAIFASLIGILPLCALAADSDADCRIYKESSYARQPLDGALLRTFTNESREGTSPGEYAKIFFCNRADGSLYVVIRDGFLGATNPPEDVIRKYNENDFDHYVVNTARTSDGEAAKSDIQLVAYGPGLHLNGNPDTLWVFRENPSRLGGMPLVQAMLYDRLAPNR